MCVHNSYPERQMYFVERGECNIILRQYSTVSLVLMYVCLITYSRSQFDLSRPLRDISQDSPPNKKKTQDSVDVVLKNLKVVMITFCFLVHVRMF